MDLYGTIQWICVETYNGFVWNHAVDLYGEKVDLYGAMQWISMEPYSGFL